MATDALMEKPQALVAAELPRADPPEILMYWRTLARRKWWILALGLITGAIAWGVLQFVTPIYRATVTLKIEQSKAKLVSIEDVYGGVSANREHYQTQAEMLKSPTLASAVIEKLGLTEHPEFDPRKRKESWLEKLMRGSPEGETPAATWSEDKVKAEVLAEVLRRITIDPVRLTQLVKVGFDSANPELAARVANALAESYIEADIAIRAGMREKATDWLADRLSSLKQNLEDSERALQQYREQEGLPETRGLAQGGAVREIEGLTRLLNDTAERRLDADANNRQLQSARGDVMSSPVVLRSPVVERHKDLERRAEKKLAEVTQRYGPENIKVIQAQNDLRLARENTREAIQSVIASHGKDLQIAAANERAAERAVMAARGTVQHMNRKEFQLDALEQDRATNRQIYERFVNRYRETRAASDITSNLVARVIDPAVRPGGAYKPRKQQITGIAVAMGLMLGAIIALMLERLNSSVKTSEEVEEKLGLPTLAVVPLLTGKSSEAAARHYLDEPNSVFSEAIRTARTSILLSAIDARMKLLLVTSSVPSEGKTSFAVNLALAHAQTKKTLLIEADLRRPSVARQLGLDEHKGGLTTLFTGGANFSDCVQRVEGSSLYVLPAGPTPENPLELLSSDRFRQLVARVSDACEVVIIDSPPVHLVSDAVVLSTMVTGVIFVVKADGVPYPMARRCIKSLLDAGAPVLGVALNQLDFSKADRYYGAYTGYSKEYGAYYGKPA